MTRGEGRSNRAVSEDDALETDRGAVMDQKPLDIILPAANSAGSDAVTTGCEARLLCLKVPSPGFPAGYPSYEIVSIGGVTEIIEHRKMEPIFYVSDDPAVRAELVAR
jgi:hypothetical protein